MIQLRKRFEVVMQVNKRGTGLLSNMCGYVSTGGILIRDEQEGTRNEIALAKERSLSPA